MNIKKIIAREGLNILGIILIIMVCMQFPDNKFISEITIGILYFYAVYLIISFVIWAMRTLKGK